MKESGHTLQGEILPHHISVEDTVSGPQTAETSKRVNLIYQLLYDAQIPGNADFLCMQMFLDKASSHTYRLHEDH